LTQPDHSLSIHSFSGVVHDWCPNAPSIAGVSSGRHGSREGHAIDLAPSSSWTAPDWQTFEGTDAANITASLFVSFARAVATQAPLPQLRNRITRITTFDHDEPGYPFVHDNGRQRCE
jgi:hypothetical protein